MFKIDIYEQRKCRIRRVIFRVKALKWQNMRDQVKIWNFLFFLYTYPIFIHGIR
jgi:hypothetical protein